jgi:hypothetical protein
MYSSDQLSFLRKKAFYIWWKSPEETLTQPQLLVAQIMDIGVTSDVVELESFFCQQELSDILISAEIGQFSPISWSFWHYRLGLADHFYQIPEMPTRKIPD